MCQCRVIDLVNLYGHCAQRSVTAQSMEPIAKPHKWYRYQTEYEFDLLQCSMLCEELTHGIDIEVALVGDYLQRMQDREPDGPDMSTQ